MVRNWPDSAVRHDRLTFVTEHLAVTLMLWRDVFLLIFYYIIWFLEIWIYLIFGTVADQPKVKMTHDPDIYVMFSFKR